MGVKKIMLTLVWGILLCVRFPMLFELRIGRSRFLEYFLWVRERMVRLENGVEGYWHGRRSC